MGYILLIGTMLVFIYFCQKHLRKFLIGIKKTQTNQTKGYYLLVYTYEKKLDKPRYYGVFQQGDKELTLELSLQLYLKLAPPQRGLLTASNGIAEEFLV